MSLPALRLEVRSRLRVGPPESPVRPVLALSYGVAAAALGWLILALPLLLAWASSAQTGASWSQALQVSGYVWLICHRVGLGIPGGELSLQPLAALALPLWLWWRVGARIGAGVELRRRTPSAVLRQLMPGLFCSAFGYCAFLMFLALAGNGPQLAPKWWEAGLVGFFATLGVSGLAALGALLARFDRRLAWGVATVLRLPLRVRVMVRPALRLIVEVCACGLALVVLCLVMKFSDLLNGYQNLAPGIIGIFVLTLAQLLYLPNLSLWGVSFLAGPGFAVGIGAQVNPAGSSISQVPLIPILGILPEPGPLPVWVLLGLALPVLCGAHCGWRRVRHSGSSRAVASVAADLSVCLALAVLGLVILMAVSGGALGPGRLTVVGPVAWQVGLALAGELSLGAALGAWLGRR